MKNKRRVLAKLSSRVALFSVWAVSCVIVLGCGLSALYVVAVVLNRCGSPALGNLMATPFGLLKDYGLNLLYGLLFVGGLSYMLYGNLQD
jgi:hypothetical protein